MTAARTLCITAVAVVMVVVTPGTWASQNVPMDKRTADMFTSICAGELHGQLLANPFDCSQFIQCDNGVGVLKQCSGGLLYDPKQQVCNWPSEVECGATLPGNDTAEGSVRCYRFDTLHFVADTRDCEKYFICSNGIPYPHHCAPGIHWDFLHQQCDYPEKAQCAGKGDINQPDTTEAPRPTTPSPEVVQPVDQLPDCSTGKQFHGCKDSCTEYYVCFSNVPYRMRCPDGYLWNEEAVKCDLPELARCVIPEGI